MERDEAIAKMMEHARVFAGFGWMLGTSGNLSVRLADDRFVVTGTSRDKGSLGPADFLACDLEAAPVEDVGERPSSDTLIHATIYRSLADAGAIYHTHEPYSALCSERDFDRGFTRVERCSQIKAFPGLWRKPVQVDLPILENAFEVADTAAAIAAYLDASSNDERRVPGLILRAHGIYAWGATADDARRHLESIAYLCRHSWKLGLLR